MAAHGLKRARPAELVPGTVSVITARMDYLPRAMRPWRLAGRGVAAPARPAEGIVSVYARGRDYHKVLRARLQKLATALPRPWGPFGHRVFTDSAPVLEAELAARSGQGWRGKHTLVLNREAGSMFFWARSTWTWPCRPVSPSPRTAAAAAPASTCAPRRPSWRRTGWMRGAASRT
jgi:epoxyqueuosine reductase